MTERTVAEENVIYLEIIGERRDESSNTNKAKSMINYPQCTVLAEK